MTQKSGPGTTTLQNLLDNLKDPERACLEYFLKTDTDLTVLVLGVVMVLMFPMNYLDFHYYGLNAEYLLTTFGEVVFLVMTALIMRSLRKNTTVSAYQNRVFAWGGFTAILASSLLLGQPMRLIENMLFSVLFLLANFILVTNRILFRFLPALLINIVFLFVFIAPNPVGFENKYLLFWTMVMVDIAGLLVVSMNNRFKRITYEAQNSEKRARKVFERLASTDELTGIPNRRSFLEHAGREFARFRRFQTDMCLVAIDLDDFKVVNDRFGHLAGDEALKSFSTTVISGIRTYDVFGRLGGDEFGLLLPQTRERDAEAVLARIQVAVRDMLIESHLGRFDISFSAGVACAAPGDESLDDLLQRADQALYSAKDQGRNRLVAGR
jgi:diguanylate cyclase (GGDEF)-like protein